MQISSVSPQSHVAATPQMPEAREGRGPDHDGDKDDGGASTVKSSPAAGVGSRVDTKA
jgi:hypothetical protein